MAQISNEYVIMKIQLHRFLVYLQIWAAGFTAAILKKRSSTINTEPNSPGNEEVEQKKEPLGIESMMLSSLEKLFPIVLNIPEVNM